VPDDPRSQVKSPASSTGVGLADVLPFLVGLDRTGRLSSVQDNAPPLEAFIERGRVVDAAWGRLRALGALEMGAVFLPHASFVFSEGLKSPTHTFELGPMDVAARLNEVAREGVALARSIPGPEAVPTKLEGSRQRPVRDPEAVRLLDQIDGRRSVAELVEGRQPLVVLRGLASLVEHGAIGFQPGRVASAPAETAPPSPAPRAAEPAPENPAPPKPAEPAPQRSAAEPASTAAAPPRAAEPAPPRPAPPPAGEAVRPAATAPLRGAEGRPPEMTRPISRPGADGAGGGVGTPPAPAAAAGGLAPAAKPPDAAPVEPSNAAAATERPPSSATEGRRGLLGGRRSRPVSLLIIGVVLLVFAFAVVDSLQTLTPEAPLPAAGRPAATVASAPTQPAAAPAPAQQATAAPTTAPQPTPPPAAQPATVAPTSAPQPTPAPALTQPAASAPNLPPPREATAAPTSAQQATAVPSAPVAASTGTGTLLDEGFTAGAPGWPNAATSSAWWDSLGYHLEPRASGQHVAIVAPGGAAYGDVEVAGLFHKSGGPAGGGYGLILRAQSQLDGTSQGGRYYVFELGDRGEVGAWRREEDRWVDLLPWTQSTAVFPGNASNRLDVRATGSQFAFKVNDISVAQVTDDSLTTGGVGVFAGGDGNQVVLERFTVTAP
jgi:hypothetical protein